MSDINTCEFLRKLEKNFSLNIHSGMGPLDGLLYIPNYADWLFHLIQKLKNYFQL